MTYLQIESAAVLFYFVIMDALPFFVEDDEDLLIYILTTQPSKSSRRYHYQVKGTEAFNLENLPDDYCKLHFRFYKADLVALCQLLGLPAWIRCRKSVLVRGIEALCITLKRLAYPGR